MDVYYHNTWRYVYGDDDWDATDARVVCRQLGYPDGGSGAQAYIDHEFSYDPQSFFLSNVQCTGSERALVDCPYTEGRHGTHTEPNSAGVSCGGKLSFD